MTDRKVILAVAVLAACALAGAALYMHTESPREEDTCTVTWVFGEEHSTMIKTEVAEGSMPVPPVTGLTWSPAPAPAADGDVYVAVYEDEVRFVFLTGDGNTQSLNAEAVVSGEIVPPTPKDTAKEKFVGWRIMNDHGMTLYKATDFRYLNPHISHLFEPVFEEIEKVPTVSYTAEVHYYVCLPKTIDLGEDHNPKSVTVPSTVTTFAYVDLKVMPDKTLDMKGSLVVVTLNGMKFPMVYDDELFGGATQSGGLLMMMPGKALGQDDFADLIEVTFDGVEGYGKITGTQSIVRATPMDPAGVEADWTSLKEIFEFFKIDDRDKFFNKFTEPQNRSS